MGNTSSEESTAGAKGKEGTGATSDAAAGNAAADLADADASRAKGGVGAEDGEASDEDEDGQDCGQGRAMSPEEEAGDLREQIAAMEAELARLREAPFRGVDPTDPQQLASAARAFARAEEARQVVARARPEMEAVKDQLSKATTVASQLNTWFVENAEKLHIKEVNSTPSAYVQRLLEACTQQAETLGSECTRIEGRLETAITQAAAKHARVLQSQAAAAAAAKAAAAAQAVAAQQMAAAQAARAQAQAQAHAQAASAQAAQAQVQAQAPVLYEGYLSHPAFGPQYIEIRVQMDTMSRGRWFAVGQNQSIEIVCLGNERIILRELAAGATQLDGVRDVKTGAIQGEVIRSGIRGGAFRLNYVSDPQRRAQLLGVAQYSHVLQAAPSVGMVPSTQHYPMGAMQQSPGLGMALGSGALTQRIGGIGQAPMHRTTSAGSADA